MVNAIVPGYILACMSKGLSAWTKGSFCCKDNQTIEGRGLGSVPPWEDGEWQQYRMDLRLPVVKGKVIYHGDSSPC
jgi:hypothetical protein